MQGSSLRAVLLTRFAQAAEPGDWPAPSSGGTAPAGTVMTVATRAAAATRTINSRDNPRERSILRQLPSQPITRPRCHTSDGAARCFRLLRALVGTIHSGDLPQLSDSSRRSIEARTSSCTAARQELHPLDSVHAVEGYLGGAHDAWLVCLDELPGLGLLGEVDPNGGVVALGIQPKLFPQALVAAKVVGPGIRLVPQVGQGLLRRVESLLIFRLDLEVVIRTNNRDVDAPVGAAVFECTRGNGARVHRLGSSRGGARRDRAGCWAGGLRASRRLLGGSARCACHRLPGRTYTSRYRDSHTDQDGGQSSRVDLS